MTKIFLENLVPEVRPMMQNGLSTVKTDFLQLCNRLGNNSPKTSKGFKTLAHNIIHGNEKQRFIKIIQFKLSYGLFANNCNKTL